jgi:hypothetical protein
MSGYVYRGAQPDAPRKVHAPRSGRPRVEAVFDPAKCGTRAGYGQHRRHNQDPCLPCKVANAAYARAYARKTK